MTNISQLAKVIRSKNAGPFLTTVDMFFEDVGSYERVKNSHILTNEHVAKLFKLKEKDVVGIFYADGVRGIKITLMKPNGIASGDPACDDVLGAAQHVPILYLDVP